MTDIFRKSVRPNKHGARRLVGERLEDRRLLTAQIHQVNAFQNWNGGVIPSTDVSDVAYDPRSGRLLLSDSEIDELPGYNGFNVFETSLDGQTLHQQFATSNSEPTGIAYSPFDGFFYVTNDDARQLARYSDNLGSVLASVSTTSADYNALDPEGVTVDPSFGTIYVSDGKDGGLQVLVYGPDLQFQRSFSVAGELTDAEGIAFHPATGHVFVLGHKLIAEYTTQGDFLRSYSIAEFSPKPENPGGLGFAPTSDLNDDPTHLALYITDRGVDNFPDGTVYEATFTGLLDNVEPAVSAGGDQSLSGAMPRLGSLVGSVSDDGLPLPPGNLVTAWSQVSGPGTVIFTEPTHLSTTAIYPASGKYVLRLAASDGDVTVHDDVVVYVNSGALESPISAGDDDVEENAAGVVTTGSTDLDLVYENGNQTIGLRFNSLAIPQGAYITKAYVQFRVDDPSLDPTSAMVITGHAADNAGPFVKSPPLNVASRARTNANVAWNPPNWPRSGVAGPDQQTADISSIVQEIVGRPGWAPGNSIALVITGTGVRTATAFETVSVHGAPVLHVEYTSLPGVDQPPQVSAGSDQSVIFNNLATDLVNLAGMVTDDGLPFPPGNISINWSMTSGPGSVTFGNRASAATTASFSAPGRYVLRLSAGDGVNLVSDELTIDVAVYSALTVDAGADQTLAATNLSSVSAALAGQVADSPGATLGWTKVSGPGAVTFSTPATLNTSARFSLPGVYVLRLTATVATGSGQDDMVVDVRQTVESRVNSGAGDAKELKQGNVAIASATTLDMGVDVIGVRFSDLTIPAGAIIKSAYVQFQAASSSSNSTSLSIRGERTDNASAFATGLKNISKRSTTSAAVNWSPDSWNSGQAGANQRTPDLSAIVQEIVGRSGWKSGNSLALVISGSGKRSARANEGGKNTAPLLHIEYSLEQTPPKVNAGADRTVLVGDPASTAIPLSGVATDDGRPSPSALSTTWTQVSGPGVATFANAAAASTSARFSTTGQYVLRLTASDGEFTVSDDVTINVRQGVEARITSRDNDATESASRSKSVSLKEADLELGSELVGLRFTSLNIPAGATITSASLQFQADDDGDDVTNLTITAQSTDNAPAFAAKSGNLSSRARTSASVSWSPSDWANGGDAGAAQQSPDLSAVIQQVVSRAGWTAGNSIVLLISGSGERVAESFEGSKNGAPLLRIAFSTDAPLAPVMSLMPSEPSPVQASVATPAGLTVQLPQSQGAATPPASNAALQVATPWPIATLRSTLLGPRTTPVVLQSIEEVFRALGS